MDIDLPTPDFVDSPRRWPRRWLVRVGLLILVCALLTPAAVSALTYEPTVLEPGTIERPANGTTVISVQGFKLAEQYSHKKPARAIGVGPEGEVEWVYNGSPEGILWFYDVDPVRNGSAVMFTGAERGQTVVTVWDPETEETIWTETFPWDDTHDVDLINDDQLLVANMREYNLTAQESDDRILVYDRSEEEIVWQWKFREHGYSPDRGGNYRDDWTHVNDVDKIGEGRYLASVRNFDQVIVVNRSSNEVTTQLGQDGRHSMLYEQHNPQYLRGEDGNPTMLVADSENDRVVEYAKFGQSWIRTWTLTGNLNWPRDADRLPNGNTLVTDTLNHRVMEVTPSGEVVWEFYAPWGTYDAERMYLGDEPGGPTTREQGATGRARLHGSAALTAGTGRSVTFAEWLTGAFAGTPLDSQVAWFAERWSHVTPWVRPVWMGPWAFLWTLLAGVVVLGWLVGEAVYNRARIRRGVDVVLGRTG